MVKNKSMCIGCRNDRYNHPGTCERPGIDAPVTCKECWTYEEAKVVKKKRVSINQQPPFKQKEQEVLECMHEPGYAYVD